MFKDVLKFTAKVIVLLPCKTIVATAGTVGFIASIVGADHVELTADTISNFANKADYVVMAIEQL
jgi:hypothetical protein